MPATGGAPAPGAYALKKKKPAPSLPNLDAISKGSSPTIARRSARGVTSGTSPSSSGSSYAGGGASRAGPSPAQLRAQRISRVAKITRSDPKPLIKADPIKRPISREKVKRDVERGVLVSQRAPVAKKAKVAEAAGFFLDHPKAEKMPRREVRPVKPPKQMRAPQVKRATARKVVREAPKKQKKIGSLDKSGGKPRPRQIFNKLATTDTGFDALTPRERAIWEKRTSPQGQKKAARRRATKLWDEVTPVTGLKGKQPRMRFSDQPSTTEREAWVNKRGTVVLPTDATAMLGGVGNRDAIDEGRRLLLHEFAHTGQNKNYVPAVDEGRAVRFENLAGDRLGLGEGRMPSPEYKEWAGESKRLDSRRKILRGQFGGRGKGKGASGSPVRKMTADALKDGWAETTSRNGKGTHQAKKEASRRSGSSDGWAKAAESAKGARVAQRKERRARKEGKVTARLEQAVKKRGSGGVTIEGPLTEGQKTFGAELAKLTGIDPQVIGAWMLKEQSWDYAEGYEKANYHNWLNIQPVQVGGSESIDSHDPAFNDPKTGARITADFIKGKDYTPGGGASDELAAQIAALPNAGSAEQQAAALGASVWGTGDISGTMPLVTGETKPTKPLPKKLVSKAKDVLGKKETKAIIAGPEPEDLKYPGRQDGALRMVRNLVGSKVKGDAGFMGEAAGVHSATGDHYAESSYAQDINDPAGNPAEGEPPYSDETLNTILKNLKKEGFTDVPASGSINETLSYEGTNEAGYRVQLYTNDNGAMNHIHIGTRYVGPGASTGVTSGGVAPGTTGASVSGGTSVAGGGEGAPSERTATRRSQRERDREQLLNEILSEPEEEPVDVLEGYVRKPRTATRTSKVSLGL
jgi:hypothetical protein